MAKKNQISLKLLINKEKNKVVMVESEGDFVDILFSFLTMPIATIVRILETQSSIGCMDNLYKSVEKLNKQHFQTPECLEMLIHPRSAYEMLCRNLKVKVDDSKAMKCYFMCPESMCSYDMLSTVKNSKCLCGEVMTEEKEMAVENDGFVDRVTKFLITDDMHIIPVSTTGAAFSLLKEFGVTETEKLEKQPLVLGPDEVLFLLKRALISNEPFTDVFLTKNVQTKNIKAKPKPKDEFELTATKSSKTVSLKLVVSKSLKKVIYAEANAGFLDFLFSFLTFPIGAVVRLLDGNSSMVCIDNLYRSVHNMNLNNRLKSEKYMGVLLDPKLPQHFNCSNQLLDIDEEPPLQYCHLCFEGRLHSDLFPCPTHERRVRLSVINPKSPSGETTGGGGFMKEVVSYMVTDRLSVNQLSPMQAITYLSDANVAINDIEERIVLVGEEEGLRLLKAALTSKTVLNDVFAPRSCVEILPMYLTPTEQFFCV